MMHRELVLCAIRDGLKARLRPFVPARLRSLLHSRADVPMGVTDGVIDRHLEICEWLLEVVGGPAEVTGKRVCEIGPGDCRATQLLLAHLGASIVDVVEPGAGPSNANDERLLRALIDRGLLSSESVNRKRTAHLDWSAGTSTMTWPSHAERLAVAERWDVVFSYAVLEHVEDLTGFMRACFRGLKAGGSMHHMIDLTGHAAFEDPVPPLDFQTYPDWLWRLMYPPGRRNTRRHASEFVRAAQSAGFDKVVLRRDQTAPPQYMDQVWGLFNHRFRRAGPQDADILSATLTARRPGVRERIAPRRVQGAHTGAVGRRGMRVLALSNEARPGADPDIPWALERLPPRV